MIPDIVLPLLSVRQIATSKKYIDEGYEFDNIRNVTFNDRNYIVVILKKEGNFMGINSRGGISGESVVLGLRNHVKMRHFIENYKIKK